jgi:hypothetical protein
MIGDRLGDDSLLEQPVEQQAPRTRRAAIESESELVEVVVELLGLYRTLVCTEKPA